MDLDVTVAAWLQSALPHDESNVTAPVHARVKLQPSDNNTDSRPVSEPTNPGDTCWPEHRPTPSRDRHSSDCKVTTTVRRLATFADVFDRVSPYNGRPRIRGQVLTLLRRALLRRDHAAVAAVLTSLPGLTMQNRTNQLPLRVTWGVGRGLLEQARSEGRMDLDQLHELDRQMSQVAEVDWKQVEMERLITLLKEGCVEDAVVVMESIRENRGGLKAQNAVDRSVYYAAVRGLVFYAHWLTLRADPERGPDDSLTVIQQERAIRELSEVVVTQGRWDILVSALCDLRPENLEELLLKHAQVNNGHVTAWKQVLAHAPDDLAALEHVTQLDPADPLGMTLYRHRKSAGVPPAQQFEHLLDQLDHVTSQDNLEIWRALWKAVKKTLSNRDQLGRRALMDNWVTRSAWWPAFHFTAHHARLNMSHRKLAKVKGSLSYVLMGDNEFTTTLVSEAVIGQSDVDTLKEQRRLFTEGR